MSCGSESVMASYVFADLDNNLMRQTSSCPPGVPLVAGSVSTRGEVSSSLLPQQAELVRMFEATARLIPVTARDYDALQRVVLPMHGYRIACHGALILTPEGVPDEEWESIVAPERAAWRDRIEATRQAIAELPIVRADPRVLFKLGVDACGRENFVGVRASPPTIDQLCALRARLWADPGGLFRCNGDDLAFLPPFASKRRAVRFLKQRLLEHTPDALFIGSGDSTADLPFMAECDFIVAPVASQIMREQISAEILAAWW